MSYIDNIAKTTGRIAEKEAESFLQKHGFGSYKPAGADTGIDRIIYLSGNPVKTARIQIKGRRQAENPRWFQLTVPKAQIRDALINNHDPNELWKKRIYMVDFWILAAISLKEIWVFPSNIIHEIAEINYRIYYTRSDNNYSNGKIEKKQKELNLNISDENGLPLWKKYEAYKNNASLIYNFLKKKRSTYVV